MFMFTSLMGGDNVGSRSDLNKDLFIILVHIERFHSREQRPYWLAKTKDDFLHKNRVSFPVWLGTPIRPPYASLFSNTNMAAVTSYGNAQFTNTIHSYPNFTLPPYLGCS